MPKKVVFTLTLLTLAACFLSYELGSAPVAHAGTLPPAPATWTLFKASGQLVGLDVSHGACGFGCAARGHLHHRRI
jgi:hypothetical protein